MCIGVKMCVKEQPKEYYDNLAILLSFLVWISGTMLWNIIIGILLYYIYIGASFFQSVVGDLLPLTMVPLKHIKTRWKELRYSSSVTQGLSHAAGTLLSLIDQRY